jgi:hypothetical protein
MTKYDALHIIVAKNILPSGDKYMRQIYWENKADDDLLYVSYAPEAFSG